MPLLVLVQQEVVELFQSVVSAIASSLLAEEGMCVCDTFFPFYFFGEKPTVVVMKVEQSSSLETSSRHRRQEWFVCMEFTVRANEDGDEEEKVAAAGGEYRVSTSAKRESSNLILKEGEGLYKLTRHKSAVFEHDFRHYANSLNRTSSEVRAQLGLHDQKGLQEGSLWNR
jgi:hypothetical protein